MLVLILAALSFWAAARGWRRALEILAALWLISTPQQLYELGGADLATTLRVYTVQALILAVCWRLARDPQRKDCLPASALFLIFLAAHYLRMLGTGGDNLIAGWVSLVLVSVAALVPRAILRRPQAALAAVTAGWLVQHALEQTGALAALNPPWSYPHAPGILWLPDLPVRLTALCLAGAVLLLGIPLLRHLGPAVEPTRWPVMLLLLGLVVGAAGASAPGTALALALVGALLAWMPGPTRPQQAAWLGALVLPLAWNYGGLGVYAAFYPGNRPGQPACSSESLHLLQHYTLAHLMPGQVLSGEDLQALMPSGACVGRTSRHLYLPAFPALPVAIRRAPHPRWLFYSNNPEGVQRPLFHPDVAVLARGQVPAGRGRVFFSHFSPPDVRCDFILSLQAEQPARISVAAAAVSQLATLADPGTELWRAYQSEPPVETAVVGPRAGWRKVIPDVLGDGLMMADVTTDDPLTVIVAAARAGSAVSDARLRADPVAPMLGSQSRGVFLQPDEEVRGTFDLDAGLIRRFRLDADTRRGVDTSRGAPRPDVLNGNYGAVTHLSIRLRRPLGSAYTRALILLVPTGGWSGAVRLGMSRLISAYGGLVLFNSRIHEELRFAYDFSLPASSYAPVSLLMIPLKR